MRSMLRRQTREIGGVIEPRFARQADMCFPENGTTSGCPDHL